MRTDGSAEKSTRPIVHAWCVQVNINATRCKPFQPGLSGLKMPPWEKRVMGRVTPWASRETGTGRPVKVTQGNLAVSPLRRWSRRCRHVSTL
jgi:hypothetical protein